MEVVEYQKLVTLDGCCNKCPARLLSADWDWALSPQHRQVRRVQLVQQTADTGHQENGKWDKRVIVMKDPRIVGTWGHE